MGRLRDLTGLFLGAGASYEAGMPLVEDITNQVKGYLTCEKLRSLNAGWNSHGLGYSNESIAGFETILSRLSREESKLSYEDALGYLETRFRRSSSISEEFHGLYSWLVDIVYHLLYYDHVNNIELIKRNLSHYKGLERLAEENNPLWIFSVNHDIIVECIATHYGIPLNSGFTDEIVSLPRRDRHRGVIGHLSAEVLRGEHLNNSAMPFFQDGTRGINLLKIHGALDIFAFRDGQDFLKVRPLGQSVDGLFDALRATNQDLHYSSKGRATNEIAYLDDRQELQFIRRSLLAGAFKFDSSGSQVLPRKLVQHFESYINYLRTLVCIGYGFYDIHINNVLRKWLEFSEHRRMVIVDPYVKSIPFAFRHIAPQIDLAQVTATDYLDRYGEIARSGPEVTEKKFFMWLRRHPKVGITQLQQFGRELLIKKFIEWLNTLPIRDGNIDIESLDMSVMDLIQEAKRQVITSEKLMRHFLEISEPDGEES